MTESAKQLPVLKKRRLTPKQRKNARISYGAKGEQLAAAYLEHWGYKILEKNTRLNNYEVDIIAFDTTHNQLVFVEVKRRSSQHCGHPAQSVNYKKLRSLYTVASAYSRDHRYQNSGCQSGGYQSRGYQYRDLQHRSYQNSDCQKRNCSDRSCQNSDCQKSSRRDRSCQKRDYHFNYRFDIIAIVGTRIEHFKNITWLT